MSAKITTLAVWTVSFDVVSDHGHIVSTNESHSFVGDSAGDVIVQALSYGADVIRGGHMAVTGATIRLNDPLNDDVSTEEIYGSRVGLVDLQPSEIYGATNR